MEFLKTILNEAAETPEKLDARIKLAKNIIQKYTSPNVSYSDILIRAMAFTNRFSVPDPNKPDEINIIKVLDELAQNKIVAKQSNGSYKRTSEALRKLMALHNEQAKQRAFQGDTSKQGKLALTQTDKLSHLGRDTSIADKLRSAPRNYKRGGKWSGSMKEFILKTIKETDPAWKELSANAKATARKLATLSDPAAAFQVLSYIINLRSKKKGYVPFVQYVMNFFNDERFTDALMDLESIGVVNSAQGTINGSEISNIREVIKYFKAPPVEGMTQIEKVSALLPKFAESAVSRSSDRYREINNILANPANAPLVNFINNKLTDERLDAIMNAEVESMTPNQKNIHLMASTFDVDNVEDLKSAMQERIANRQDYRSDANIQAKDAGRFSQFLKTFDI